MFHAYTLDTMKSFCVGDYYNSNHFSCVYYRYNGAIAVSVLISVVIILLIRSVDTEWPCIIYGTGMAASNVCTLSCNRGLLLAVSPVTRHHLESGGGGVHCEWAIH